MKGLKTILGIALSVTGFGGAAAVSAVALNDSNKIEVTEAAGTTTTVYLDLGGSSKFKQSGTINCHYWGGSSNSSWPGTACTKNSNNVYEASIPSNSTHVIFNLNGWNGDCQTENLAFDSSKPLWTITSNNTNGSSQTATATVYQQTIYVLDKQNIPLSGSSKKAHLWKDGGTSVAATTWPGSDLTRVGGSNSHIYSVTTLGNINRVIFHNNEGNQTGNLSIDGQCSVLETNWDGTKWVSLEAAQFVDGYMHLYDVPTTNVGSTANCSSNYQAARTAYNALSSNTVRKEALGVSDVSDRLSKWAKANGSTLNTNGIPLSSSSMILPLNTKESGAKIAIIISILLAAISTGTFFFIRRKRKESY